MSSSLHVAGRPAGPGPVTAGGAGPSPTAGSPAPAAPPEGTRWPGVALCAAIALAAVGAQWLEVRATGAAHIEALVLAILLGAVLRTAWRPGERWRRGISFSARELLEVAVVLLGATLDVPLLLRAGPALLAGIAGTVVVALATGYAVARLLGLSPSLATLIACGNAICGNSAIAAVAPVIGADGSDVAAAIAFTAVLGVVVVLALPPLGVALGLSQYGYGVVAGLSVYAVPQVIAATFPVGAVAGQVGTLVKLVRVLMLGPVVVGLSLLHRGDGGAAGGGKRPPLTRLVPWFILGFLALAAARAVGLVPAPAVAMAGRGAGVLTLLSMAALGMGVDVRVLARVGARVTTAVIAALSVLVGISLLLVHLLRL